MKSRKMVFRLVVILGVVLLVNGNGVATDYYVDDAGCCDPGGCGSSIGTAISGASSGDTVYVCPGTYTETFSMKNGVDVISTGDNSTTTYTDVSMDPDVTTTVLLRAKVTIIDGNGTGPVVDFDGRTTSFTTATKLDGFIIQNALATDKAIVGITADNGKATVTNCIVHMNRATGAGIGNRGAAGEDDTFPTISNNVVHDIRDGPGIGDGPDSYATITGNKVWDCSDAGIGLLEDAWPTIEDNIAFENGAAGIGSLNLSANGGTLTIPPITGNTTYENTTAGISLVRHVGDTGTINATIGVSGSGSSNHTYKNTKAGIRVGGDIDNVTIVDNEIHENGAAGIKVDAVADITIEENKIYDNNNPGIQVEVESTFGDIDNVVIQYNEITTGDQQGINFYGDEIQRATVYDNDIFGNADAGIIIHHGAGTLEAVIDSNNISRNSPAWPYRAGIVLEHGWDEVIIKHNSIHNNGTAGIRTGGDSTGTTYGSLVIAENQLYAGGVGVSSQGAGVRIVQHKQAGGTLTAEIIGNEIYSNSTAGLRVDSGTGTIAQNNIYSNNYAGIAFMSGFSQAGDNVIDFDVMKNIVNANLYVAGIAIDAQGFYPVDATVDFIQNRVSNAPSNFVGGGMMVVNATGAVTLYNNLVFDNGRGGMRFGPSTTEIKNNTVVDNGYDDGGLGYGGGIIFSTGNPAVTGYRPQGEASSSLVVKNNISTHNQTAGLRVGGNFYGDTGQDDGCPDTSGDAPNNVSYNLLYANHNYNPITSSNWDPDLGDDGDCFSGGNRMCVNQQAGGCYYPPGVIPTVMPGTVWADPLFVDKGNDDYHVMSTSPAKAAGESSADMGCYGGDYPMNNLIDIDTSTGNTSGGANPEIVFDLGASYTVTDIRLYSNTADEWDVYVGTCTTPCTSCTWGTAVLTNWTPSTGWDNADTTDKAGRYIRLVGDASVAAGNLREFRYKRTESWWDGSQFWYAPSFAEYGTDCNDLGG